jgi:hypothetical protein
MILSLSLPLPLFTVFMDRSTSELSKTSLWSVLSKELGKRELVVAVIEYVPIEPMANTKRSAVRTVTFEL